MAVTTNVIKNDRQRAVVQLIASAAGDSSTITMLSLRRSDELALSTTSNLAVNIAAASCNVTDATSGIIVTRNGTAVLDMRSISEYPGANNLPAIAVNNGSSIVISFQQPGMFILDLRKVGGYEGPNTNVGV
jgi:hypothetical protein